MEAAGEHASSLAQAQRYRERGEREARARGERETTGYEPFALHAPIQWYVAAEEGVIECRPCRRETGAEDEARDAAARAEKVRTPVP